MSFSNILLTVIRCMAREDGLFVNVIGGGYASVHDLGGDLELEGRDWIVQATIEQCRKGQVAAKHW